MERSVHTYKRSYRSLLRWIGNLTIILFVIDLIARFVYPITYAKGAFVQIGLMYDKVCYLGSYEMIVCPSSAPPFETLAVILTMLFLAFRLVEWKTPTAPRGRSNQGTEKR